MIATALAVWVLIAVVLAPVVGRLLRGCRLTAERQDQHPIHLPAHPDTADADPRTR